jgi:hypothetical protein
MGAEEGSEGSQSITSVANRNWNYNNLQDAGGYLKAL